MIEKLILQSDEFIDGQIHTFDFESVEIERSINCLTMLTDEHCLEVFSCDWKVSGIYRNRKAKKPQRIIIIAQRRTLGDVVAVVEVDLSRRFKPVSTHVTETRQKFIASSEMLAEGGKTMPFGRVQVRCTQQAIRVTDRYLQAEFIGSWELRSVLDKTKDNLHRIEIDVYKDEKICAYLSLKR
jgi:hypothetical protein